MFTKVPLLPFNRPRWTEPIAGEALAALDRSGLTVRQLAEVEANSRLPATESGATANGAGVESQARAARDEQRGDEKQELIQEMLRRENMLKAYQRVVRNGGAPGVDGGGRPKRLRRPVHTAKRRRLAR